MGPDLTRALHKLLMPLRRRMALLLARGVGKLADSSAPLQLLQIELLKDEVLDNIEHLEAYGFTSCPLPGYEALAASLAGDRGHTVVLVATDRRYRKKSLAAGEVALYTDEGDVLHFKRGRLVEVIAGTKVKITAPQVEVVASTQVTITSPLTAISGNTTIGGTLAVTGDVTMQATASVAGMATVGGLAATGAAGASSVSGNLAVTGGDVTVDGISSKTHVHGGVTAGAANTGAPQ